jgi:serine/threonine protein kinase
VVAREFPLEPRVHCFSQAKARVRTSSSIVTRHDDRHGVTAARRGSTRFGAARPVTRARATTEAPPCYDVSMGTSSAEAAPLARSVGRYSVGGVVASGGMASIHLGHMRGAAGFSRTVAIKRMHAHFTTDPDFTSMFADEARLAARVRHPNVVPTLDVVMQGTDLCIVMEYVHGATLAQLSKLARLANERVPPGVALAIVCDALQGLHAAHEAVDAEGHALGIVHRDVSPQNIIVGIDGVARVLDFGIAKANVRLHQTREGGLKGKLAYMAPEQLEGASVDRASDIFAASVVLWEALTGVRLYAGANEGEIVTKLLKTTPLAPSHVAPELGTAYDALLSRGLARDPSKRFATAREMALALDDAGDAASDAEVGEWVERVAAVPLAERAARVRELEKLLRDDGSRASSDVPDATSDDRGRAGDASRDVDPDETRPATPATMMIPPRAPARRSRAGLLTAIAVACAVAVGGIFFVAGRTGAQSATAVAPSRASAPAPAPASASASASASAPASAPAPAPAPAPASAPAPAPASASPAKVRAPAPPRIAPPPPPARIPDHL